MSVHFITPVCKGVAIAIIMSLCHDQWPGVHWWRGEGGRDNLWFEGLGKLLLPIKTN